MVNFMIQEILVHTRIIKTRFMTQGRHSAFVCCLANIGLQGNVRHWLVSHDRFIWQAVKSTAWIILRYIACNVFAYY